MSKTNIAELSVSEIANSIKKIVEDNFGRVKIKGEVTGYRGPHTSGHCYFALKDANARLEAIIWRGVFGSLQHEPKEGLEVVATGKLTTYPNSSRYQIIIEKIEPAGAGALMALLIERRKKLQDEGLFNDEHKKPLPFLPRKIAIITSPTGAVIEDIKHRIKARCPLHILLYPAKMQGDSCAGEVVQALDKINKSSEKPDLIIIARGGGSFEDLWGFNDEKLVRAVFKCQIPIISAIGHETDWTLLDYVADKRAPTPTGAAEIATPLKAELLAEIADYSKRHKLAIGRLLENWQIQMRASSRGLVSADSFLALPRQKFDDNASRLSQAFRAILLNFNNRLSKINLSRPAMKQMLNLHRQNYENLRQNFAKQFANNLANKQQIFNNVEKLLASFSYKNILARGFAVVRGENMQPISSAKNIANNQLLNIEMKDGTIKVSRH